MKTKAKWIAIGTGVTGEAGWHEEGPGGDEGEGTKGTRLTD